MGKVSVKPHPVPPKYRTASYHANANYGADVVMAEYANYSGAYINAVIPHGVFYETQKTDTRFAIYPGEAEAKPPYVLNYPANRDEAWSEFKEVIPCAAPYLYAHRLYPHAKERRGTLLFPQHNTDAFDMHLDWWELNDFCHDLPAEMKPVTVVLYWKDLDWQDRFTYPNKVKCMGHVNDPEFLKKLVYTMTGAKYLLSNDIGSYIYYGLKSGLACSLIAEPPVYDLKSDEDLAQIWGAGAPAIKELFFDSETKHPDEKTQLARVRSLFPVGEIFTEPTPEQIQVADYYLRSDALMTPEELKSVLIKCETPPVKRG